tara:strand:+ start:331 stop:618 length:288 start_codon:yes stop_codon:yes gene_type:complete
MKQKLYDLKMQILKDLSIKDDLKKDLAEQIFQIEKDLAINDTRCCETLKDKEEMTFDEVKHLENKHNVLNKVLDKQKNNFKLQIFENGKWVEVPL